MRTVFVGGGRGCEAVLRMVQQQRLASLSLRVVGVVDIDPDAPGMVFARSQGWPTFTRIEEAVALPDLELVIEITGLSAVRRRVHELVPRHVRVMDHTMARVFWDLDAIAQHLREELKLKTRLEEAIREDRRRLQELLDSLPDVVMVVDERGRIQRVNRRFEEVTGVSGADAVGQMCFGASHGPAGCGEPECPREMVLDSGQSLTVVQRHTCFSWERDKREVYYEVTATPTYNSQGGVSVVMTSREVTDQVLLKRETEEAARRFEQIISTAHGLITIKGLDGRYQVVNPSAARFCGLSADQMVGRSARELFPPDVADTIERGDCELMEQRAHVSREEVVHIRGEDRILISERILLTDYRGRPVGICCVSRDVTEPRRLQRELVQSERHAAVGKLAAGVAHEINNPLTGILTFAEELLEDTPEGEPARDDIEVIIRETLRCRQIVRDLLDFSRQTTPNRRATSVRTIVKRALDLVRKQAAFHDITFDVALDDAPLRVRVDAGQMQQVLLNLVINARDAMDGRGTIKVRAGHVAGRDRVEVSVQDHGCGIAAADLPRVFEPFFSTKGDQGNGLGLAAVKSIVEQHEGVIVVESAAGRGALFRITLPAARDPGDERAAGPRSDPS